MKPALCFLLLLAGIAVADQIDLATLPPEQFLAMVREPLRDDVWGEFTGSIQYKSNSRRLKGILRVRITFSPESMNTTIPPVSSSLEWSRRI